MRVAIETPRLLLRELTLDDVDALQGIFSDPVAMRFYESTRDRNQTVHWVHWARAMYGDHGFGLWAAGEKETGGFAGQVNRPAPNGS